MDSNKDELRREIDDALESGAGPKVAPFVLACLGGVPTIGGAFGATADAWSEAQQDRFNRLLTQWLKLQEEEIKEIGQTLVEVMVRLDPNDPVVQERIATSGYLSLVKKCFRDWSAAESEEKRILIRNLLTNAAATKLTEDDIVRLFVEWIDKYSETHFKVIRSVYQHSGTTRQELWEDIHGGEVREDSAEADLFKLIIHDLSVGHIIRQHREVDAYGKFVRKRPRGRRSPSATLTSAFDDEKEYVLTGLGKQFVHYTMNEVVPKIAQA